MAECKGQGEVRKCVISRVSLCAKKCVCMCARACVRSDSGSHSRDSKLTPTENQLQIFSTKEPTLQFLRFLQYFVLPPPCVLVA